MKKRFRLGSLLLLLALLVTACGSAAAPTIKAAANDKLGTIVTDAKGMTLYYFVPEKANGGSVACTGECAKIWPPLLVTAGSKPVAGQGLNGSIGTVKRPEGTEQVTYNGLPLYYFANDKNPGDTNGQGVKNVWYVVPASGK